MATTTSSHSKPKSGAASIGLFIVCIVVLLGSMIAYWYYPYPSGKHPDLASFIIFWLKELLIVGAVLAVAVYLAISRFVQWIQRYDTKPRSR